MHWTPLIITVAPNGARKTQSDHAALPMTAAEIAADAVAFRPSLVSEVVPVARELVQAVGVALCLGLYLLQRARVKNRTTATQEEL